MTRAFPYNLPMHILYSIVFCMLAATAGLCSREAPVLQGLLPAVISTCDRLDSAAVTSEDEGVELLATLAAKVQTASIQWKFTSNAADGSLLRFRWLRPTPQDYISLWLKNPAGQSGRLTVSVEMQNGLRIAAESQVIGEERNWYQLAYQIPAGVNWDAVTAVAVALDGLEAGQACEFYVDEIVGYRYPALPVKTRVEAPAGAAAGASIDVNATVSSLADRGQWPLMRLALEQNGFEVASALVAEEKGPVTSGEQREISGRIAIPMYIPAGDYAVTVAGDVSQEDGIGVATVRVENDVTQHVVAVDAAHNTLKIDNAKISPIFCEVGDGALPDVPWSPSVYVLDATSDHDPYGHSADVWLNRETFDYSDIDARLGRILQARPDALIVLRVYTSAPEWWMDANPAELVKFGNETQASGSLKPSLQRWPSWASAQWREDAVKAVSAFVAHVEASPAKNAVIAYELCSGEDGNWVYPGTDKGLMSGYGAPQLHAFQRWLQERYGSLAELRVAWGQPLRPFETEEALEEGRPIMGWTQVEVPSPEFRRRGHRDIGILREPTVAQEAADYDLFASDAVVDAIELLAAAVKDAAPGKLCGASYGHIFDLAQRTMNVQGSGHLALSRAVASELLDFLTAPSGEAGSGETRAVAFSSTTASIRAHGKLAITEIRPHEETVNTLPDDAHVFSALASGSAVVVPAQPTGSADWGQLAGISDFAMSADAWHPGEVAIVVDDVSLAYVFPQNELLKSLLGSQRYGLANMGAVSDVWLLEDVLAGTCPKYPFYIFLDAFNLDRENRLALRSRLMSENAGALYFYAAGCIDDHVGGRTALDLMGISIIPLQGGGPLRVEVPYPLVSYGDGEQVSPRFFCRVYDEDEIGSLSGTERAGLVAGRGPSGNIYWSVAPDLPASLLSKFALESGVHLLTDAPLAVSASGSFVCVRAGKAGTYAVSLSEVADIYDSRTGKAIAPRSDRVTLEMEAGETVLLYIEGGSSNEP